MKINNRNKKLKLVEGKQTKTTHLKILCLKSKAWKGLTSCVKVGFGGGVKVDAYPNDQIHELESK